MYRFRNVLYVFSVLVCGAVTPAAELINLEDRAQEFVRNVKQIKLMDYPHAFNPSIIRWNGSLLLSFRTIPDPKQSFTSFAGLVWLDDAFEPISEPQILPLRDAANPAPSRVDDARLISIDDRLYVVYSDNEDLKISRGGFRMYIAELGFDGTLFYVKQKERIGSFEGSNPYRREKNWVPFEYKKQLLLAYSIIPHRILRPILGTGYAESVVSSESALAWQWGELRGGTPGLINNDHYLAFFHSSIRMATTHSQGTSVLHYFIGAYLFSAEYPFVVTHMSPEPIIGKQFYTGQEYKPYWHPVRAVFPCGFVQDDTHVWVVYGRQDHEMWVAEIDKRTLYEHLVPVSAARIYVGISAPSRRKR